MCILLPNGGQAIHTLLLVSVALCPAQVAHVPCIGPQDWVSNMWLKMFILREGLYPWFYRSLYVSLQFVLSEMMLSTPTF